ncbi:MAG: acetyl-CoA C-acyltransferase, partial [SAR324 cluster bacterium]|nr:acetyl-CoA C-acyltransferase [SAR324 cluster bacterium]
MPDREVVVLSGVRTAVGTYGGTLKDQPLVDMAAKVVQKAVQRAKVEPAEVGQVVFGNVIHTDPRDMYLARYAGIRGGLPIETPAFTLNRLCGSGLQSCVNVAQEIQLGEAAVGVAAGAESMSQAPMAVYGHEV